MSREDFYVQAAVRENGLVDWENGAAIDMTPAHSRHEKFVNSDRCPAGPRTTSAHLANDISGLIFQP